MSQPMPAVTADETFDGTWPFRARYTDAPGFGKLPVLDYDGFQVYEATAITRYVDDAFDGPELQPQDAKSRARMNQVIGIVDSYVTPLWMLGIVMPRLVAPMVGEASDEGLIKASVPKAKIAADVLESFLDENTFFAGDTGSIADFFLYPPYVYAAMTDEAALALPLSRQSN